MSILAGRKNRHARSAAKVRPTGVSTRQSDDKTSDPIKADARNFYKVEKWTKDGM